MVKSACNAGDTGSIPGLGRSLEKGMATHSSILGWRMDRRVWQAIVHWVAESDMAEQLTHTHIPLPSISKNKPST